MFLLSMSIRGPAHVLKKGDAQSQAVLLEKQTDLESSV